MTKKILVVEDELVLQRAYAHILNHQGYAVSVAGDGRAGLKQLHQISPDLILLDILMPRMDGIEFLKRARVRQNHPHTIVIAFSNLSKTNQIDEMIELGARKHVLKSSMSPNQLAAMVSELLGV